MNQLTEGTKIGKVVLNVENREEMKKFYEWVVGLETKAESATEVTLGVPGIHKELLVLQTVEPSGKKERTAGLYHMAFLLPKRKDLGEMLYHLLATKYPIVGASDHGYSEAVYLDDPEGNGVEIYWDKPKTEWDILEDGSIAGITEQLDAEGVLSAAEDQFAGLPAETVIGHVHLFVRDLQQAQTFYKELLGFDLKYNFGADAKFFAAGEYHHHIGTNVWAGSDIPAKPKGVRGLKYYTVILSPEEMSDLQDRLKEKEYPYSGGVSDNYLEVEDPDGIVVRFEVK